MFSSPLYDFVDPSRKCVLILLNFLFFGGDFFCLLFSPILICVGLQSLFLKWSYNIHQYVIIIQVWFIKRLKKRFQFCRSTKSSILTRINSTNHLIMFTRRNNLNFNLVPSLNLQTSI